VTFPNNPKAHHINSAIAVCLFLVVPFFLSGAENSPKDWPQWRGPNRDGVAPAGPKLLDSWPTKGPLLLWKSAPIGSGPKGGAGSVTVAGGKAFVFVHSRKISGQVVLTTKDLADMGWIPGVSAELVKKIDAAIATDPWRKAKPGLERDAYIKAFMATLNPQEAESFGAFIHKRMEKEPLKWNQLEQLALIRDKEIPKLEDLADFMHISEHESVYHGPYQVARALLNDRFARYFDTVICLDTATGKQLWMKDFPGVKTKQMAYWGASCTPAVWDNKCYATGSAGLYCLSVKDGSVVWQAKTNFSNSSPLVMDGVAYVMVPELTAFNAQTGHVLWSAKVGNTSGSVVPWINGGKHYVIGCTEDERYGGLFCVDAADGKVTWTAQIGGGNAAMPVVVGDTMIMRTRQALLSFKLTPQKAEQLWSTKVDADEGSPLVYQDCVYITGGHCAGQQVGCYDLKTGKLLWSHGMSADWREIRCSSPVLADGKIIAIGNTSDAILFNASPEKYVERGRISPKVADCTSPTVAGGRLYLRLEDCVACYDLTAK
jgi:outer membrane protein assembly factor BamB